jgi:fimbrial isopeptide formation D2 family protein
MKNETKISIVLALMMIVSTLAVGTVNADPGCYGPLSGGPEENLEVVKKVWNGTAWADEYTAEVGESVQFKITITYYEVCGYKATNITVVDSLDPSGELVYSIDAADMNYSPSEFGNPIVWNLTTDHGIELFDGDSVEITFNVTICKDCGDLVNAVSVYADETCCHGELYGDDQVTVTAECDDPCEPEIEVNKTVWDGTAWVDYVDDLLIGDIVKFKIEIIYHACDDYIIQNMIVEDILPCCLEYVIGSSVITTTGNGTAQPADIIVSPDKKEILWDWTYNNSVALNGEDSLIIEFDAIFTEHCQEVDENCVYVEAWGCSGPTFEDEDCASVDCSPPDTEFEKKVKDGQEWVDEINTTVGDTLRFKLSILYYGEGTYDILRFKDVLPCILEYADNAMAYVKEGDEVIYSMPIEGDLCNDTKTVWFNLTYAENFTLEYGVEISVEFDATVTGLTECGCECEFDALNKAWLYLYICEVEEAVEEFYDEVEIHSEGNCPPYSLGLEGPSEGEVDEELDYTTSVVDPDDDQVYFKIDWDDDSEGMVWQGPYDSGEVVPVAHTYAEEGVYQIKIKAKDEHGLESEGWTSTIVVTITDEEEPPVEELEISIPSKIHLKNVHASIKNKGEGAVSDVSWTMNVTKSGLIFGFDIGSNGAIASIDGGASETIHSGPITLKFGMATIEIKATAGALSDTLTANALVLGRLVIIM